MMQTIQPHTKGSFHNSGPWRLTLAMHRSGAVLAAGLALAAAAPIGPSTPATAQTYTKAQVRDFLNSYVRGACRFSVPRTNVGIIHMYCDFRIDESGRMRIRRRRNLGRLGFGEIVSEVALADLDPRGVFISNNPGFRYMDVGLECTNKRECVREQSNDSRYRLARFYVPVQFKKEARTLVKAFEQAIRLYGGKENLF